MELREVLDEELGKASTPREVRVLIGSMVEYRAALAMIASSDVITLVSQARDELPIINEYLLKAFCKLPDNTPKHPLQIRLDGKELWLQSVAGDTARYVTPGNWRESELRIEPTPVQQRRANEEATMAEALAVIQAAEGLKVHST